MPAILAVMDTNNESVIEVIDLVSEADCDSLDGSFFLVDTTPDYSLLNTNAEESQQENGNPGAVKNEGKVKRERNSKRGFGSLAEGSPEAKRFKKGTSPKKAVTPGKNVPTAAGRRKKGRKSKRSIPADISVVILSDDDDDEDNNIIPVVKKRPFRSRFQPVVDAGVLRATATAPPPDPVDPALLRPVVIDGSNVAFGYGKQNFSSVGLKKCVDWFERRGHKVLAFVPQFRRHHPGTTDQHILDELEKKGVLVFTPSRKVNGKRVVPYDDRYIVEYASEVGGVIVSRDTYQDLLRENPVWSDTINNRLLMFTWANDKLMFPQDPLGRGGPTLNQFLQFTPTNK